MALSNEKTSFDKFEVEEKELEETITIIYEIAKKYRINAFARVTTLEGLKKAILELGPCYISTRLYKNRPEFWRKRDENETTTSGHAVAVVGYNKAGLVLRNSWGPEWELGGHIVMPYEDFGEVIECWVPMNFSEADECRLSGAFPSRSSSSQSLGSGSGPADGGLTEGGDGTDGASKSANKAASAAMIEE